MRPAGLFRRALTGRTQGELTDQQIGIQVFGRAPGYNSAEDTIVRLTARHLRQRLQQYYATEGAADPVRIEIPRGGYVASLIVAPSPAAVQARLPAQPLPVSSVTEPGGPPHLSSTLVSGLLGTVAVLVSIWYGSRWPTYSFAPPARFAALADPPGATAASAFTPGRRTVVVPGDACLDAYIAWEQRCIPLEDYSTQL